MSPEQLDPSASANRPLEPLSEASGLCGGPGQMYFSEANELIQAYLHHHTDPDTGALVAAHLGDCPPCESEFAVYQRILEALGRCRPDVPSDTAERLKKFCTSLCDGTVTVADADDVPS